MLESVQQMRQELRRNSLSVVGHRTVHLSRSAMQFDELLDQRQSDSKAALRSPERAIDLHEHAEDAH